jgi:hypothetical protein
VGCSNDCVLQYDDLGRAESVTVAIAGLDPVVVFAQTFDAAGNRTQLAATLDATADFVSDYEFDGLNRLHVLQQHAAETGYTVADKRCDFAYNAVGQFDLVNLPP